MRWIDCFTELIAYTDYILKGAPLPPLSCESVIGNFRQLISRAEGMAGAMGLDNTSFREAFFPVCVWIDERVLCSDWPEKGKWGEKPLQKEYFDTTHGGEEFFARLEALDEKADRLREIYACCLAMGFKGRYYLASDQEHLAEIKAGNIKNILSDADTEPGEALFPESYRQEPGLKPADKRKPWRRLSIFSVIAFLVPIALFALVYTLSNRVLDRAMEDRFGIRAPALAGKIEEAQAADPGLKSDPKDRSVPFSHQKPAGPTGYEYTVRKGDTLNGIAASVYGNPLRWVSVYRHNREAMEKWEKEPGFPERPLPSGLKLEIKPLAPIHQPAAHSRWVVNLRSSTRPEEILEPAVNLVKAGYPAYLSEAEIKGQKWLRLRVGFFATAEKARTEGEKIRREFAFPRIWVTRVEPAEVREYGNP